MLFLFSPLRGYFFVFPSFFLTMPRVLVNLIFLVLLTAMFGFNVHLCFHLPLFFYTPISRKPDVPRFRAANSNGAGQLQRARPSRLPRCIPLQFANWLYLRRWMERCYLCHQHQRLCWPDVLRSRHVRGRREQLQVHVRDRVGRSHVSGCEAMHSCSKWSTLQK